MAIGQGPRERLFYTNRIWFPQHRYTCLASTSQSRCVSLYQDRWGVETLVFQRADRSHRHFYQHIADVQHRSHTKPCQAQRYHLSPSSLTIVPPMGAALNSGPRWQQDLLNYQESIHKSLPKQWNHRFESESYGRQYRNGWLPWNEYILLPRLLEPAI